MKCRWAMLGWILGVMSLATAPAFGATATATLTISVTVVSACRTSAMPVPQYRDRTAAMAAAVGSVDVSCTMPTPYSVTVQSAVTREGNSVGSSPNLPASVVGSGKMEPPEVLPIQGPPQAPPGPPGETLYTTITY